MSRCTKAGCLAAVLGFGGAWALEFPGPQPGPARARLEGGEIVLGNSALEQRWRLADGRLTPLNIKDLQATRPLDLAGCDLFRLTLSDGRTIVASDFRAADSPAIEPLDAEPRASILAHRFPGRQARVRLVGLEGGLEVTWRAMLRDGGNAIRQEFTFTARKQPLPVKETLLVETPGAGAKVVGVVPGSPIVLDRFFFAFEHPDSRVVVGQKAAASLGFNVSLLTDQPVTVASAAGIVPEGQLRRGFLYYVERERAHPYRPFLHYNAWYDICWGELKIRENQCLEVIDLFARELIRNRGVPLASFVWDDGWDDPRTLWRPVQTNFPAGFGRMLAAARGAGSTLGFWLSPFGGYGKPAEDRLAMGRQEGFETGPKGFSLAGPKYFRRFQETCLGFIERDGANFFKFDGLARSVDETEAMLRLTRSLRGAKPDLFISITTGTWPSPFWLWYGDSTWRGGGDMGFHGAGSKREQWITYRDLETYKGVVRSGPLYPLNSLMTQGFAHARYGSASECGNSAAEIRKELRSFFASGTCLQELYVTPAMMSAENWDDLAEAAKWSHANADVLVDTHWVGGDPAKGEPYGWASWTPRKGVLALRNPSAQVASLEVDIGQAFELPPGAKQAYRLRNPWGRPGENREIEVRAGAPHTFALEAFEVAVLETGN